MEIDSMENSPVIAAAKGKAKAKAPKEPLAPSASGNAQNGKSVEEIYQKMTQLEHIMLRPDTYIGSTEHQQIPMWVVVDKKIVQKPISFVPGLYKIFDEILVNAADNKVRDSTMDALKVDIDPETNTIKVLNNGAGIPVEVHKVEGVYVPELIFGHLLTSSNYDDNQKKITGGRNGYGAKLANIFSSEFTVETCDGSRQKKYKQTFTANMTKKGSPKITACKATDNYTSVTFKPDLAKFGMAELEADTVALMTKRVYDLAGVLGKGVKVSLNGERVPIKGFSDYVDMYLGAKEKDGGPPRVYEKVNDRWEVCISVSDGSFQQVSFANSICTYKGGTHVNHVTEQVTSKLLEIITKKHKTSGVKAQHIKNHIFVFVNAHIENPAFDSQTKENLTLKVSSFGSKCGLTDAFLKKVANCGVMENVLSHAAFRQSKELKKNDGAKTQRLTGIPKLDDANDAGGRNSAACTLILTEGDSAKTLAVSGLSVVGRDKYGVFPLRGKLLNVRDATHTQIMGNAEIKHIQQILGLQHGKVYTDTKGLRYGHIMIMTDQDQDGSHIKGLIMNFIHHFYPSLLKVPGFLVEFITPIIKSTKGRESQVFYTLPEYESWRESLPSTRGWSIKYYKGLGTSTAKEAKEYFANLEEHKKDFVWQGEQDGEAISMAFAKKRVEERKTWLREFQPGTFLDHTAGSISYHEFIHKELILFSRADLVRSIPSMVDGFKPGQRKILYSCFKRNLKSDIKVAQLSGYVAEHSAYHHGEASLASTIVGLAQDFVGSNNVNLLVPSGQFGTRLQGGKDCASPRYIFTRLAPIARSIFHPADDALLNYLDEEGQTIEPEWYMPILPMVLVNGAEGIGTGWSTSIPNYNPRDIVDNLKRLINGEDMLQMAPWYRGFNGSIQAVDGKSGTFQIVGSFQQTDGGLDITELPVRKWTQDYKEFLEGLMKPENKNEVPLIADYREYHTDTKVHFSVTVTAEKLTEIVAAGLEKKLKLQTSFSTGNMMLWDKNGTIRRFETAEDIVQEFYGMRLQYYGKRRDFLIKDAEADLQRLSNRMRFILEVIDGKIRVNNRRKKEIEVDLEAGGYDKLMPKKLKGGRAAPVEPSEDGAEVVAEKASYDYLLSMPIWSLTLERVEALRDEADKQTQEVERLKATAPEDLWNGDLDAFLVELDAKDAEDAKLAAHNDQQRRKAGGGKSRGGKKAAAAGGGGGGGDDSDDDWAPKARKPAAKRAPAAKKAVAAAAPAAPKPISAPLPPAPAALPAAPSAVEVVDLADEEEDDTTSYGSLAQRLQAMNMRKTAASASGASNGGGASSKAAAKPSKAAPRAAAKASKKKPIIESSDEEEEDSEEPSFVVDDDSSEGEPEIISPFPAPKPRKAPAKAAQAAKKAAPAASSSEAATSSASAATAEAGKRKPAPAKKPRAKAAPKAAALPPTPQSAPRPANSFELESPSPALAHQGKVRRMRESPFHKGSGSSSSLAPVEEISASVGVLSYPQDGASPAPAPVGARPRRAAAKPTTYVVESDDDSVEIIDDDGSDYEDSD